MRKDHDPTPTAIMSEDGYIIVFSEEPPAQSNAMEESLKAGSVYGGLATSYSWEYSGGASYQSYGGVVGQDFVRGRSTHMFSLKNYCEHCISSYDENLLTVTMADGW